ncbi:MAG: YihY/virulence factor BrkB family protein [Anaerolineales bacterium]|nr:YihY/virulence factor BrkB family protein [Anaerolineales bacterium]
MSRWHESKYLLTQTYKEWREDDAARLAAALSYYTIFSLPPLLIIILAIAGQVFVDAQTRVTAEIAGLIGDAGGEAIAAILENAADPAGTVLATLISVATLFLGASGVFGQLQDALNTIWEVQSDPNMGLWETIKRRFFSFTMVLGVGFLLLVSLLLSTGLAAIQEFVAGLLPAAVLLAQILNFLVSFGIVTLLFALIFKVIPDVQIAWRDVWIGSVVTALLFTLGKWAIGFYLGRGAPQSTYGAAGSLIIILLWVYYSAQLLFLGAEFTQVYANRYGKRLVPDEGAISLEPEPRPAARLAPARVDQPAAPARSVVTYPPGSALPSALEQRVRRFHAIMVTLLALPLALAQILYPRRR